MCSPPSLQGTTAHCAREHARVEVANVSLRTCGALHNAAEKEAPEPCSPAVTIAHTKNKGFISVLSSSGTRS